jgi:hypothetical protein
MELIKSKKSIWIVLTFLSLILLFFFFPKSLIELVIPNQPILLGWNFDLNEKKLPVSVDHIDFLFSEDLDKKTILKENISITPNLEWNFSLINSNTVRFILENKLNVWDNFLFTFSDKIKSTKWKNIDETNFELEIVSNAKVIKINPEWNIDNLNQNISVFFSLPMVPLTDLDSRDNLPCPIKISPNVEWKCSWTTTSVLEFVPENRLFWSTDYEISVNDMEWLLYPLVDTATWSIKTPRLDFYFNDNFNVNDWLKFSSNFDVSLDEINDNVKLYDNKWDELSYISSKEKNNFILKLKDTSFDYETNYNLKINSEIKSVNWNIVFDKKINKNITSFWFLNRVDVFKSIYSSTWELIDTRWFYIDNTNERSKYIPVKDVFFNLSFQEEVLLDKNNFSFYTDTDSYIDFDLSYIDDKKYNKDTQEYEVFTNKKKLKFTLKWDLLNDKEYKLVISKNINKFLKDDVVNNFYTSKELVVNDFKFIDYSKSCLYLSNQVDYIWNMWEKVFSSSPESRAVNIHESDYIPRDLMSEYYNKSWNNFTNNSYSSEVWIISSTQDWIDFLADNWYCRPAKSWEYLYVLNTRLNPNSNYELNILNDFEDRYWNKLSNIVNFNQTTSNILDKDKYLYSSVSKDINVIPNNLPIVINLQTINLDNVVLDVCEMDEQWFIDWQNNNWQKWFTPKCINSKKWNVNVKNNFWNLTFNKIDLEKDFLKNNFSWNFILVSWKIIKDKYEWDEISFSNIYIRSNISVAYENWENKQLFFVTDYDGNQISNLDFNFYSYNYTTRKSTKVDANIVLNNDRKVFENVWKKPNYDYVIIKDKNDNSNIWFLDLRNDYLSNYDFKYISWETTSEKKYLYLYTERPIYKPGDTVYFKWLLREFKSSWYTSTDLKNATLELVWPSQKVILTNNVTIDSNSNFSWEFIIPKEVDLWKFTFRFKTSDLDENYTVRNNAFFHIEEYSKPTFKVNVNDVKNDFVLWENLELNILPEYYFGWKIINTTWDYSVLTQNYFFDAKDYSDYNFGEWSSYFDCIYWGYCNYSDYLNKSWTFEINQNGEYNFSYKFEWEKVLWEKIYNFNFDVIDPDTSRVVWTTVSKVLHNTDSYVWIKSNYYNSKEKWILLDWIVLDFDAKEKSNKNIVIELIKKEYKSVKKKWVDWIFYNDYSLDKKLESTYKAISDSKWMFTKTIKTKTSWEYEIRAIYTWENNKEFVSSKSVYVAWDEYVEWHNDNNDVTDLTAEKVQVNIWDKADYLLKSPVNNWKALIVIEKDNDILDYFIHDIKSYSDKITIDVKDTYYPNYYIKAFLIWNQENNPLPIYKRALTVTKVSTDYKKLSIDIETNKEKYLPQQEVNLKIKVKDYLWNPVKNADVSISIVDESLLALKWNPKKNPYAFFYDLKRYLWISTYSSLKNLIEKLEVKDSSDWEKWWAWEQVKWWDSQKKRWEFKDTAFWQASWVTDENGYLNVTTTKLPDNLTTWVIEVLANTKDDTKLWVSYDTIITSKELLISDNLPNFFWSNDTVILSPVIFNKTWENKTFNVELNITNAKIIWDEIKSVKIEDWGSKTVNFEVKIDDIWITQNPELFTSKINIKASPIDLEQTDEIEKFIKIIEVSTPEYVSTFWKTNNSSFEEKLSLWNIKNSTGKLTINYWVTLLNSILDWVEYLNNYPYGCSEQKTSAIMPNVFIKKLYNSVWVDFDLNTKMIKYWAWDYVWYADKSVQQVINEYLVNIRKYQKIDWWFVYFYDLNYWPNYSDFALSSYILESAANIRDIWFKLDEKTYYDTIKYLKNRFYTNQIEWCYVTNYNDCKYLEVDRLKAIWAILDFDNSDYEAFKMYKLLDFKNSYNSLNLEKSKIIAKLLRLNQINSSEKKILEQEAINIVNKIISEELVFNPKWAYLGKSDYYSRFRNTVSLLETISIIWLDKFNDISPIIDNMNRWIIWQKQNWSFGSTSDNIALIKAVTNYLESSLELNDIKNFTKIKLNNKVIEERNFNDDNKLEVFSKTISTSDIKDENSFVIEKDWNWTIYYDLNLSYYKDASEIKSRDQWFFIETSYYKYDEYKKIESIKKQEWDKYINREISYEELQYPKNIFDYLFEIKSWNVWDLLVVRNKIVTTETRDNVAFEWFIPSWSELLNPNLDTSSKKEILANNLSFDKLEYRTDRIFGYKQIMYPWIFEFTYLMRLTHSWDYSVKPSFVSEFYNVEVFGRNEWKIFNIYN